MNKIIFLVFALFLIGSIAIYSAPAENQTENNNGNNTDTNIPRTFFRPMLSYTYISLGDIQAHNAIGGLTLYRFNPNERDKLFSVSLAYSPQIVTNVNTDFPNLYHTATLAITQKINRHTISGAFIAMTDKPVYGGSRTFIGMARYSYDLINGQHFSMDLGGGLSVMDIGLTLDNGMPWLLWPIPSISLSWEYEWLTFGLMSGLRMTIAPKFPVSLIFKGGSYKYDASLWYRHFKNGNSSAERVGIGIGIKRDSIDVMFSDGGRYGIDYDTIYGSIRLLRFFEINGGWAFNGKGEYEKVSWETLFKSDGNSDDTMYNGNIGKGFFVSISVRMSL
jgi:hypothetical protein